MKVNKKAKGGPWLAAIYGTPTVGKSTLAAYAPKPLFIDTEGGLKFLDVGDFDHTDPVNNWDELRSALVDAFESKDHKTIVVDGCFGVEEILTKKILEHTNADRDRNDPVTSLADKKVFGFGLGYQILKSEWILFLDICEKIIKSGKNVLLVGHEKIDNVTNPQGDDYNRHSISIQSKSVDVIAGKLDAVFYAEFEKVYRKKANSEVLRPIPTKRRIIHTIEKPYYLAKNRFNLDDPIEIKLGELDKFWALLEKKGVKA